MSATPWYIKATLYVALPAACIAALYLSIPGEVALAKTAGWSEHYAPAMPVCLSVYALAAGAISAYRRKMELPGQLTALVGSLMALLLAMSAQSISHLIEQDYMGSSAALVVAVSCVPPLTIAHMVHMAETPAQVKTASQEMDDLRAVLNAFTTETALSLIGRSQVLVREYDYVKALAGEITEGAEELNGDLGEALEDAERALSVKPRRKALELTPERIEQAKETLAAEGKRPTVERVCEALGISQATYYRYREPVTA